MEKEFAEALRALRDAGLPADVLMIGPNAMILGIAVVAGAVILVAVLSRANVKFSFGKAIAEIGKSGETANGKLDSILERIRNIELDVLRLNLISEENPTEERVRAGEEYVKNGGNGKARELYERLKKQLAVGSRRRRI